MTATVEPAPIIAPYIEPYEILDDVRDPFVGSCPPWCGNFDKAHSLQIVPEDRNHWSEDVVVSLELEKLHHVTGSGVDQPSHIPEHLSVGMKQNYRETSPRVLLGRGDDTVCELTVREAKRLAEGLLTMVTMAGWHTP